MPVDLNGKESNLRSYPRGRDLEIKRAKGEASCAECRRLKLKCDRKTPCTSCVRRGCQTICPNGSLTTGQGSRYVLANTDQLHDKLLEMSKRIRQLEDALQIAHASVTPARHALLSEDLLAIKSGVGVIIETEHPEDDTNDLASGLSSDLGALTISERGEACFMGRSSTEALLMVINESLPGLLGQEKAPIDGPHMIDILPQQIISMSKAFPFSSDYLPKTDMLKTIEAQLPSYARATALVEAYLANIAWAHKVVDREQIFEDLLPSVYKRPRNSDDSGDDGEYESDYVHCLALLLSVLAAGAAGDLTLPIANDEAELYNHLARAALGLKSVFFGASMECVQAVIMLASYDISSCRKQSLEPSWKMMSFGLTLASSIGLHRDPARWNMEPKLVQRRRRLFWEIFAADKWKSLESGRPAMFNLREVDCEFPEDKEATLDEHGSIIPGFWRWKYQCCRDVVAPIAEQLCLAKSLRYSDILELDRKLRDIETHPLLVMSKDPEPDEDVGTTMRRFHWAVLREVALLFVHRSFFARAMLDNPGKPLGSPFVSSLLSGYASAVTLLKVIRVYFGKYSSMLLRQWMIWAHGLTAAVIVGSVACRGPVSHAAASALKELEATVELYKEAQIHPVPRRALPFLLRLLERAKNANQPVPTARGNARHELSILGGAPFFLNKNRRSPTASGETTPIRQRPQYSLRDVHILPTSSALPFRASPLSQRNTPYSSQGFSQWEHSQRRHSDSTMTDVTLPNTLSQIWPAQISSDTLSASNATLQDYLPPFSSGSHRNAEELSSTSWLEELSSNMPTGLGENLTSVCNVSDVDFLMGIGGDEAIPSGFPRPEQDDDPLIAEAWRSLLTNSQGFDPQTRFM